MSGTATFADTTDAIESELALAEKAIHEAEEALSDLRHKRAQLKDQRIAHHLRTVNLLDDLPDQARATTPGGVVYTKDFLGWVGPDGTWSTEVLLGRYHELTVQWPEEEQQG